MHHAVSVASLDVDSRFGRELFEYSAAALFRNRRWCNLVLAKEFIDPAFFEHRLDLFFTIVVLKRLAKRPVLR